MSINDCMCTNCKKSFSSETVKGTKLKSNVTVVGISPEAQLPNCPHCDYIFFFGGLPFIKRNT
jgi:hypothetical protein